MPETVPNPRVDYGTSTLFRFSVINENPTPVETKANDVLKPDPLVVAVDPVTNEYPESTITGLKDLKGIDPLLYDFAEYLSGNRSNFNKDILLEKSDGISVLSSQDEGDIWLYILNKVSSEKKDIVLEKGVAMLRANSILNRIGEFNTANPTGDLNDIVEELRLMTNSSVVIPKEAIPAPKLPTRDNNKASDFTSHQQNMLSTRQSAAVANVRTYYGQEILNQISKARQVYNIAYNEAYKSAKAEYDDDVRDLLAAATPENPAVIPPFEFTFPKFDVNYFNNESCFADLVGVLNYFSTLNPCLNSIEKIEEHVKVVSQKAIVEFNKLIPVKKSKTVEFNGHSLNVDFRPPGNSFLVRVLKMFPEHNNYTLLITHYSRNGETRLGDIDVTVSIGENDFPNRGYYTTAHAADEFVTYVVLENAIEINSNDDILISGTIVSENGNFNQVVDLVVRKSVANYIRAERMDRNVGTQNKSASNDGQPGNDYVSLHGVKMLGVMEYMRVEQSVCCYVPGEVSHIENIMAREYKEKLTRLLTREDITTEEAEEREDERSKDVSTTDRYELQKEISIMLAKEQSQQIGINAGVSAGYSNGTVTVNANAGTNINLTNSSSYNQNTSLSENFAQEITQKATERIVKKVSYKRIAKMLREHEETNKHGFDNRGGSSHVTGIYRWVDKIFKNILFNYGKRLIYEFSVPEPSKNFKHLLANKLTVDESNKPEPPVHPKSFLGDTGDSSAFEFEWSDINEDNYANFAAYYNADVEACPLNELSIGKSFAESATKRMRGDNSEWDETIGSFKFELEIPDGFVCKSTYVSFSQVSNFLDGVGRSQSVIHIDVAQRNTYIPDGWNINFNGSGNEDENYEFQLHNLTVHKVLPVGVTTYNTGGFCLSVIAVCERTEAAYVQWKKTTYLSIMEAYNKKYQNYLDSLKAYQAPEVKKTEHNYNPGKARIIEARELKKLCLEMMARPFNKTLHFDHYEDSFLQFGSGYIINQSPELDYHTRLIKFFEEAFEWEIMSYTFLPYFYANRQDFETLINEKSPADPLFEAFLQSAMANVRVTVRPGYERMVMYYFDTGWVSITNDFLFDENGDPYRPSLLSSLAIESIEEQKKPGKIKQWETRIPTDLIILQSGARPLQQNGLPCTESCNSYNGIGTGTDPEMSSMQPYNSDYGDLIQDIKTAVVEVVNAAGEFYVAANTDPEPPTP